MRRFNFKFAGSKSMQHAVFMLFAMALLLAGVNGRGASQSPAKETARNNEGWREAESGYRYEFPRDHGAHTDYRIEWWYYTGNLEARDGRRFGFQLTFFRVGVARQPENPSRWAVRDLYMTHFAISDIEQRRFHFFERLNRGGIGWAGAEDGGYRVWNEGWEARLEGEDHVLKARDGDFEIDLRLRPEKPPVIHGEGGISQKGPSAGNASHYVSITRFAAAGRMRAGGEAMEVNGAAWMDHEFGTSFLESEQIGWDWFSIQLEDGRELMLFQIRRANGSMDERSSGTLIEADGRTSHIGFGDFSLSPAAPWRSPSSGATYPTAWTIEIPQFGLRLRVTAAFAEQELRTTESTGVTYWEGSVNVESENGTRGRGYLEMTGYSGQNMSQFF